MKTLKNIPLIICLLSLCFIFTNASAQELPTIATRHFHDSLHSGSSKSADGRYYFEHQAAVMAGARMNIHFSAFGPQYKDLCMEFIDLEGNKKKYLSDLRFDMRTGTIDLDTTFPKTMDFSILFTSEKSGEKMSFFVDISYALKEYLTCPSQQNVCWKIGFILKHSDNGFKFITGESTGLNTNATSAPMMAEAAQESKIVSTLGSLFYSSIIARGTKAEVESAYNQLANGLPGCMGTVFTYTSTTDASGLPHLNCVAVSYTEGQTIHNLKYMGDNLKPQLPKYKVSIYIAEKTAAGKTYYELIMDISNQFVQY